MIRREVEQRLKGVVVMTLRVTPSRIRDDADLRADLMADSLDMATLCCGIEEAFGVRLSDDEVAFCQTFGTAVDVIAAKLENGGAHDRRRA